MNQLKKFFSQKINEKMIWLTIIMSALIIAGTTFAVSIIVQKQMQEVAAEAIVGYEPNEKQQENLNENVEDFVDMNALENTNSMTEEELQKLNEKEVKEAEKKSSGKTTPANKYYIKVNYGAQVVNVYTYDKDGKYTVPVKAFVCSTGIETPTSGVYRIPAKMTWCKMIGDVYAHYVTQIVGNILFHSVPYLEKRNDTLEYWAYDKLGKKDSLGCVRLTTRDALWLFNNISIGTKVEFYSSSNPGPLGKPTAQKISNAPGNLKNWDPTDPDPKNPWRNYKPENDDKNNTTNQLTNNTNTNKPTNNTQTNNTSTNEMNNTQTNNTTNNETNNTQNNNNQASGGNPPDNNQNNQENNQTENTDVTDTIN